MTISNSRCISTILLFLTFLTLASFAQSATRDNVQGHIPPSPRRHAMDARHESDHIREHLDHLAGGDSIKDSTPEQMEFYYFKLHDYDGDNRLDGNEIGKALTHFDHKDDALPGDNEPMLKEMEMADMVDSVLADEDTNGDGYIDYTEYVAAQKREIHGGEEIVAEDAPPPPAAKL